MIQGLRLCDRESMAAKSSGAGLGPKHGGWALLLARTRLKMVFCTVEWTEEAEG